MVLIRLQGCGVGCPWCDTKETWDLDPAEAVPTAEMAIRSKPKWTSIAENDLANMARTLGGRIG
jgi:7-carboxy-7-deazaguanine synthase